MDNPNKPNTLYYDLAKGGIVLLLLLALFISWDRGEDTASPVASGPEAVGTAFSAGPPSGPEEPDTPGIAPPVVSDSGMVTFSGTGTPGSTIEIWANGEKIGDVAVTEGGTWVYEVSPPPGDYQVIVVTRDSSGNIMDQSSPIGVAVPSVSGSPGESGEPTPGPDDEPQSGPEIAEASVSVSGEVTITGTGEPGSTVVIVEDGIEITTVVVGADGTFTVTYQSTVGEHVFDVQKGSPPPPDGGETAQQPTSTPPAATPEATTEAQPTPTRTPIPIPPGGLDYTVQPNEWLVDLARRYYGDPTRWVDIYVATNTKATLDPSYAFLSDPNFVVAGWKIFIPEK